MQHHTMKPQLLSCVITVVLILLLEPNVLAKTIPTDEDHSMLIVGGIEAEQGEFPFTVGIRKETGHHCGGSIINSRWIVTAAHCSTGDESSYTIVAGDHYNNVFDGTEQNRTVTRILIHPNYNALTINNDIALMRVTPPFEFNDNVQPIDLARRGFIPTPTETVVGWGRLTEGGNRPTVLMKVEVPFVAEEDCRTAYPNRITEAMTCAGEGGKDACQGDSGGPLICRVQGRPILCGIVSWGTGCARPDKPGVYAKVSHFATWISETLV